MTVVIPMPRLLSATSTCLSQRHAIQRLQSRTFCASTRRSAQPFNSSALDTKQRPLSNARESAGPFHLGMTPSSQTKPVKKWSELSAAGKVQRTTARTTNLTVILFGAGMSAVLVYCLTSELFSKNSPTVLHGEACKRIQSSAHLAKFLHAPLSFHNNPPTSTRPRHRNHQVASQLFVDAAGREHLYLNFHVKASSLVETDQSYWQSFLDFSRNFPDRITNLTWNGSVEWAEDKGNNVLEKSKASFKYLVGSSSSPATPSEAVSLANGKDAKQDEKSSVWKSAGGIFSALRGAKGVSTPEPPSEADGSLYTEGEVHADLVKNNDGYFVFRYILVDIPDSRTRNPVRIFVEKGPGVRENEPIMRWNNSA